nr:uncharacterized protein LOC105490730 isoform X4 [Macaca nemestrina]
MLSGHMNAWSRTRRADLDILNVHVALAVSNKSIKSEHPCLAPNHRGKPFSFSPLIMMLAVGFSHVGFIVLRVTEDVPFSMFSLLYLHVQAREAPDMYDNGRELQVRKPARS